MNNHVSLYLAVDGAARILEDAVKVNQDAVLSWQDKWESLFDSALFDILIYMSTFAGIVAIVVWMTEEIKEFNSGGEFLFGKQFYTNLMWSMFIMAMLVPGGDRLASLVQGIHSLGQQLNQQVLEFQLDSVALEDAIRATVARGTLYAELEAQAKQCTGLIGERQFACLANAHQQADQMVNAYESEYLLGLPQVFYDIRDGFIETLGPLNPIALTSDFIDPALSGGMAIGERVVDGAVEGARDGLPGIANGAFRGGLLGALGGTVQLVTQGLLLAVQWAFVNLLELAMLLTALVSPFALALSFLPGRGRPILAWAIAYTSMIMVQFYYNIIVGLMANVVINSNAYDINGFLLILAIFAPLLAIKLAQGGGMAVFDTLASGSVGLALSAAGIALKSSPIKK